MNSIPSHSSHQVHHHATPSAHPQHFFGQLPPTTYEATPPPNPQAPQTAPITVDTSYNNFHPSQQVNGGGGNPPVTSNGRRGPGSIKWTKEGVSTSAERRLPFVHRFRPVDLPPPVGLVTASSATSVAHSQHTYSNLGSQAIPTHSANFGQALKKMSQYDTNPIGALQERFQSKGILPKYSSFS